jgi:hypothetical protein
MSQIMGVSADTAQKALKTALNTMVIEVSSC